jgi:cell wall-associated NlpC family hydrolase
MRRTRVKHSARAPALSTAASTADASALELQRRGATTVAASALVAAAARRARIGCSGEGGVCFTAAAAPRPRVPPTRPDEDEDDEQMEVHPAAQDWHDGRAAAAKPPAPRSAAAAAVVLALAVLGASWRLGRRTLRCAEAASACPTSSQPLSSDAEAEAPPPPAARWPSASASTPRLESVHID